MAFKVYSTDDNAKIAAWSDDLILIGAGTGETDDYGNDVGTETRTTVQAIRRNITSYEFYRAAQSGIKPQTAFTIHPYEYSGQQLAEYDGCKLSLIRQYLRDDDNLELYYSEKVGDQS